MSISDDREHSDQFLKISRLIADPPDRLPYSEADDSWRHSLFETTDEIKCCSLIHDDAVMLFSKCMMCCGSYFLERSSPSVDDDDIVIVLSLLSQDIIYLSGYIACSSLAILYEVKKDDIDMGKSLHKFLLYDRSPFGSFADRYIVDGEDDDSYSPLLTDRIEKIWHEVRPIHIRRPWSRRSS